MRKYHIRPITLCKAFRNEAVWTYRLNFEQTVESCVNVWYIEGSEPKILVDAGGTAEMAAVYSLQGQTYPMKDVQSLESGLATIGLKPEDIEIVILTHLHWDHVGLAYKFTNAEFIVQKAELDFGRNPHPASAMTGDYDTRIFNDLKFRVIEGDMEVIDGVRVLFTPGHSPGGQSVAVDTPQGVAIITGFCSIPANFDPPPRLRDKGFPVITPGLHIDIRQAYDSILRVKQAADIILPLHKCAFIDEDRIP